MTTTMLRVAVLTVCLAVTVHSMCNHGDATINDEGRVVCEAHGEVLEVNEIRLTANCFNCTCSYSGYHCCGVGSMAGVGHTAEGQTAQVADCHQTEG